MRAPNLWGFSMTDQATGSLASMVRTFPRPVFDAPVDERAASVIDVLQEHLMLAREGKFRSIAVVSVSADGTAISTQWSCEPGDSASLIGKLTVLTHDLMASRR
jgi:hypothetical protein